MSASVMVSDLVKDDIPARPGVYMLHCVANDTTYIGSTCSLQRRLREHRTYLRAGRHENPRLQAAWNKYGGETFAATILSLACQERLLWAEQLFMDAARADGPCFNIMERAGTTVVGIRRKPLTHREGRAIAGLFRALARLTPKPITTEPRLPWNPSNPNHPGSPEMRARNAEAQRANMTPERVEHLRVASAKGRAAFTPEMIARRAANAAKTRKGYSHKPETVEKIRERSIAQVEARRQADPRLMAIHQEQLRRAALTPEERAAETSTKLSAANVGKKLSYATRAKMSAAQRGRPKRQPPPRQPPAEMLDAVLAALPRTLTKTKTILSRVVGSDLLLRRALDRLVSDGRAVRSKSKCCRCAP